MESCGAEVAAVVGQVGARSKAAVWLYCLKNL